MASYLCGYRDFSQSVILYSLISIIRIKSSNQYSTPLGMNITIMVTIWVQTSFWILCRCLFDLCYHLDFSSTLLHNTHKRHILLQKSLETVKWGNDNRVVVVHYDMGIMLLDCSTGRKKMKWSFQ